MKIQPNLFFLALAHKEGWGRGLPWWAPPYPPIQPPVWPGSSAHAIRTEPENCIEESNIDEPEAADLNAFIMYSVNMEDDIPNHNTASAGKSSLGGEVGWDKIWIRLRMNQSWCWQASLW